MKRRVRWSFCLAFIYVLPGFASPSPPHLSTVQSELEKEKNRSRKSALAFHPTIEVDDPMLKRRIYFWKKIFSWYGPHHVILHNTHYPWVIYKVIKLPIALSSIKEDPWRKIVWEKRLDDEIRGQQEILLSLSRKLRNRQKNLTAAERAMQKKFNGLPHSAIFQSVTDGAFRSQRGMKHDFQIALGRADKLLPEMTEIFRNHGVPEELTRIPFIESMFRAQARSHVGAVGIWQIMPLTAEQYGLEVSSWNDERLEPIKATDAAARFLKHYFHVLRSWPLAITAYNHGITGIRNAVNTMGTREIQKIVQGYRGPMFGFASQNFYAEFMAALELERFTEHYFGQNARKPSQAAVRLRKPADSLLPISQ